MNTDPGIRTAQDHPLPQTAEGLPASQNLAIQQSSRHEFLMGSVRRCDFFAEDETDEFRITREDGTEQGIFKVWAAPVIPVLDTGELDVDRAMKQWSEELADKPFSLFESLEQWRAFSGVQDRRLQQIFDQRELPQEPEAATAELLCRLNIAFAHGAPFYNLEALVADSREETVGNPIDFTQENVVGGKLDAVAMLLPAALHDHITAARLNWNGLQWDAIRETTAAMQSDFLAGRQTQAAEQFKLLTRISNLANVDPEDVLFAANALQFIPADVGGKAEDLPQQAAIAALHELLDSPTGEVTTNRVAKDMNALIRFLNWQPVVKSDRNFQGKFWTYDAVCATSAQLVEHIRANPEASLDPAFVDVFMQQLSPQLDGLDATSAKGRFLMQLWNEGKFSPSVREQVAARAGVFMHEMSAELDEARRAEEVVDISDRASTFVVGGKANGLRRAMRLFGEERVLGGGVITTEAIGDWLGQIEGVEELVRLLGTVPDVTDKLLVGEEIVRRIEESEPPEDVLAKVAAAFGSNARIVLRSSSFDEDVDIIGPAPGVYESVVDIDAQDEAALAASFKTVVSSFFSDKAISFRELKGLRHQPLIAVTAQEFIPGPGGSVFIQDGKLHLNIAPSPEQLNQMEHAHAVEEHTLARGDEVAPSALLTPDQIRQVTWMAEKAEEALGPSDIEFVVDPASGNVKLLQLRSLERPAVPAGAKEALTALTIGIDDIDMLPRLNGHRDVNVAIGPAIDLESFQGALFRWVITNKDKISAVSLANKIPATCHFVNIMESLGIRVLTAEN